MTRLELLRRVRSLSLRRFADELGGSAVGVDFTTASRWETGHRKPTARQAVALEAFFGESVDSLLSPVTENAVTQVDDGAAGSKTTNVEA